MIEFDFHISNPHQTSYNTAYIVTWPLTKNKFLEISIINKTYTWFKIAFAINNSPFLILGLCKFVICIKVK
jgi:hypothetical protein